MASQNSAGAVAVANVDLCIVGAGVAGLNALAVATEYLDARARAALVDRRPDAGGMWNDTYSYVRLHQPYEFFTAGDIAWRLRRAPDYLATKPEVLDHLRYCRDVLAERVALDEYYGWTMDRFDEHADGVRVHLSDPAGGKLVLDTPILINAYGFNVTPNQPLALSSSQVKSVSPDFFDFSENDFTDTNTPVWIIGGGKTAMDTAYLITTRNPGREVHLVAGAGTFFNNREAAFPIGMRRWWAAKPASQVFSSFADMYDGTNDQQVTAAYRARYGISPMPESRRFLNGNLSPSECDAISAALSGIVTDYLVDVVDRDGMPQLVFRSHEEIPVVPGSWVVNCTGYILRERSTDDPYVSEGGRVLTINSGSAIVQFSTYAAYFLTHLAFLGKLDSVPLYQTDIGVVARQHSQAAVGISCCLAMYNIGLIADEVPLKVFTNCGVDFDKWAPMPLRLAASTRFMLTHRRKREQYRRALDIASQRLGFACGPLVGATAS